MSDEKKAFDVGYGKPPRHTRFKAGRSGNPKGRPKGTRNFMTDLTDELSEQIQIRERDHALKVTKQRALIKALVARALQGDARAATQVLTQLARTLDVHADTDETESLIAKDREILNRFLERQMRANDEVVEREKDK